jgi:hypothetical protein
MIEKCTNLRSEILSKLETINLIQGHPERYPNQNREKLSQYRDQLTSQLAIIKDRVSKCLKNPKCNTTLEGVSLPEMKELDQMKELPRSTRHYETANPISLKYQSFKEILGNPKNGEQMCFDGKGRYRLYENGAIFLNPGVDPTEGAYEIHGPIFQHYKKENMESHH